MQETIKNTLKITGIAIIVFVIFMLLTLGAQAQTILKMDIIANDSLKYVPFQTYVSYTDEYGTDSIRWDIWEVYSKIDIRVKSGDYANVYIVTCEQTFTIRIDGAHSRKKIKSSINLMGNTTEYYFTPQKCTRE